MGKRETTSEDSCTELCAERGTRLSANREVISSCNLTWVEDTFVAFSQKVNHGITFESSMWFIDFFQTHSQFFHVRQRIVVRQECFLLERNSKCNSCGNRDGRIYIFRQICSKINF